MLSVFPTKGRLHQCKYCCERFPTAERESHNSNTCRRIPVSCENICGVVVTRDEYKNHLEICGKRTACPKCNKCFPQNQVETHKLDCLARTKQTVVDGSVQQVDMMDIDTDSSNSSSPRSGKRKITSKPPTQSTRILRSGISYDTTPSENQKRKRQRYPQVVLTASPPPKDDAQPKIVDKFKKKKKGDDSKPSKIDSDVVLVSPPEVCDKPKKKKNKHSERTRQCKKLTEIIHHFSKKRLDDVADGLCHLRASTTPMKLSEAYRRFMLPIMKSLTTKTIQNLFHQKTTERDKIMMQLQEDIVNHNEINFQTIYWYPQDLIDQYLIQENITMVVVCQVAIDTSRTLPVRLRGVTLEKAKRVRVVGYDARVEHFFAYSKNGARAFEPSSEAVHELLRFTAEEKTAVYDETELPGNGPLDSMKKKVASALDNAGLENLHTIGTEILKSFAKGGALAGLPAYLDDNKVPISKVFSVPSVKEEVHSLRTSGLKLNERALVIASIRNRHELDITPDFSFVSTNQTIHKQNLKAYRDVHVGQINLGTNNRRNSPLICKFKARMKQKFGAKKVKLCWNRASNFSGNCMMTFTTRKMADQFRAALTHKKVIFCRVLLTLITAEEYKRSKNPGYKPASVVIDDEQ